MNREKIIASYPRLKDLYEELSAFHAVFDTEFQKQFNRSVPFADQLVDRWDRAEKLGFGKNTSVYDSSYIFGEVQVGKEVWIGPFTIIDGTGKIKIGDYSTISSGVHIYTHDNIKSTLTSKKSPIEREPVEIGYNTYIGPQSIVLKGITIGNFCVIGANTLVNKDIPDNSIVVGSPGRIIGMVRVLEDDVQFLYKEKQQYDNDH